LKDALKTTFQLSRKFVFAMKDAFKPRLLMFNFQNEASKVALKARGPSLDQGPLEFESGRV
jgi:hypothetical protein